MSTSSKNHPLIYVQGLKKSFIFGGSGKIIEVLKGIELTIRPGDMLAIEGASGAGKSTLLHILGALDRPTEGKVYFQDVDLFQRSEGELAEFRNRHLGFVFQFHHLLPEFTALENTMMPGLIQGVDRREASKNAEEILVQLGLGDRMHHKPGELSGGEQQRVAVARALMMSPPVILADEPTGNLDTKTGEDVHNLMLEIGSQKGVTIIVVTHNPALASRMNRRVILVDGKLYENG
ncbi:MAG: ABC transporter ATP-binding protein [Deltaproteobacteria bacterium]|nr:ABC transporter ATP-binding protein [Deltaproteobacteria bacterium]